MEDVLRCSSDPSEDSSKEKSEASLPNTYTEDILKVAESWWMKAAQDCAS